MSSFTSSIPAVAGLSADRGKSGLQREIQQEWLRELRAGGRGHVWSVLRHRNAWSPYAVVVEIVRRRGLAYGCWASVENGLIRSPGEPDRREFPDMFGLKLGVVHGWLDWATYRVEFCNRIPDSMRLVVGVPDCGEMSGGPGMAARMHKSHEAFADILEHWMARDSEPTL